VSQAAIAPEIVTRSVIADGSLIETQLNSYQWFLTEGLREVLQKFSPMEDFGGKLYLEFGEHRIGPPKRGIEECRETESTYEASLFVQARLVDRSTQEVKESEIYLGEIPLMTEKGTFLINGAERVVVSQLARSPGVYFKAVMDVSGRDVHSAQVIPDHGNWVEFDSDSNHVIWCKVGQGRKFPATLLLKALSHYEDLVEPATRFMTNADILRHFGKPVRLTEPSADKLVGKRVDADIVDPESKQVVVQALEKIDAEAARQLARLHLREVTLLEVPPCVEATVEQEPTEDTIHAVLELFKRIKLSEAPNRDTAVKIVHSYFFDPKRYDLSRVGRYKLNKKLGLALPLEMGLLTKEDIAAIIGYIVKLDEGLGEVDEIDHLGNKRVRAVGELLAQQFRVGLSRVEKIARERMSTLDPEKMVPSSVINFKPLQAVVRSFFGSGQLSQFMDEVNPEAELTHKRRLSALGPGGLSRRSAKLEVRDVHHSHYGRICPIETPEGQNVGLIGYLAVMAKVDEFGFLLTPYRKVVNGKVTDAIVYLSPSDEGEFAIAPADTPVDSQGRILGDRVTVRCKGVFPTVPPEQVDFIDVSPKQLFSVGTCLIPFLEHDDPTRGLMAANMQRQAVPLVRPRRSVIRTGMEDQAARDSGAVVLCRRSGTVVSASASRIVVDASLSALVGSTADRNLADPSSGEIIVAAGEKITAPQARRLLLSGLSTVRVNGQELSLPVHDLYLLANFRRTNQSTCVNQRPLVRPGQRVEAGQVLADGASTDHGTLALGRDVLVAYAPWHGYNYEDAIVISERLVKEDIFTSVHVDKYETQARDTKVGPEEITRDIPSVGDEALRNLDENGIVYLGAEVGPDDILVGKVAPKGPSELSAEEKLIVAIFSKKAEEMRDVSLRAPYSERGKVIAVRSFSRLMKRCPSCEFTLDDTGRVERLTCPRCHSKMEAVINENLQPGVSKLVRVFVAQKRKIMVGDKLAGRHGNKGVIAKIVPEEDMPFLTDGTPVDVILNPLSVPSRMNVGQILETHLGLVARETGQSFVYPVFESIHEDQVYELLEKTAARLRSRAIHAIATQELGLELEERVDPAAKEVVADPDQLLQAVGQALQAKSPAELARLAEWLAVDLQEATPSNKDSVVEALLQKVRSLAWSRAGIDPSTGRCTLIDGMTGLPFGQPVVVGLAHILKLAHLVEDKIHARSTGPYSLVTQQPLGGKAQMGGQRFGEMEVWALEAYGAAHSLQEILTVKSDDVEGRVKTYEALVKGENIMQPGVPESFVVLVKELQSLGLDITVGAGDGGPIEFHEVDEESVRTIPF